MQRKLSVGAEPCPWVIWGCYDSCQTTPVVLRHIMRGSKEAVDYVKGILCGLAAIFVAESVFFWPILGGEKATGVAVLKYLLLESILSPRFWTVGILLFGLLFAASRGSTVLRVLFFWIPTITVSALGFLIVAAYAYLFAISRHP